MRALVRLAVLSLVLVALPWGGPQAARADDAPQDDSAASKAFRDAWWAETGGGNLTQALDLYAKSADADGPASVRARALYRRAVVLQRIGKTEDAIRALERLAKDFPGEADLQTQARARLTEWTAVDLRTSFGDWFRRYQYSPEFQAKIVDLVFQLGSSDDAKSRAAEAELLMIGSATIPALKEHLAPRNDALQYRAIKLLLLLGEVPDRIVTLGWWMDQAECWVPILKLPRDRAAALAARIEGTSAGHRAIRAALGGPEAALAWVASPPEPHDPGPGHMLFEAVLPMLPKNAATAATLAAIVADARQRESIRLPAAWWIESAGFATAELARAWAKGDSREVRHVAWTLIRSKKVLDPAQAWAVFAEVLSSPTARGLRSTDSDLVGAFFVALEAAPWPESLELAASAFARAGGSPNGTPGGGQEVARERYRQILERVFADAKDVNIAQNALTAWLNATPVDRASAERLGKWAREAPLRTQRDRAIVELIGRMTQENLDLLLDLLTDPAMRTEELRKLWRNVFIDSRWGPFLLAAPERTQRLLAGIMKLRDGDPARDGLADALLYQLAGRTIGPEALIEAFLTNPMGFPMELWKGGESGPLREAIRRTGRQEEWRAAWRTRWPQWAPEQRSRALVALQGMLGGADAETRSLLRAALRAGEKPVLPDYRHLLLQLLGDATVEDVRALYDLTQPEDVDAAAALLATAGVFLQRSPELFHALALALRLDGKRTIGNYMADAFCLVPEVGQELVTKLLAHRDAMLHYRAVIVLADRSSAEDEALWLKALQDPQAMVRVTAVKAVARVPTPAIKRVLVEALDDRSADVRAAALVALEEIQKAEDLKARWRERVK